MIDLNTYIYESIFDDEDVQMDRLEEVTEIGNFYKLWWYDIRTDHDFAYFFKKSDIRKLAQQQGGFNADWYGIALKNVKGSYMTKTKNQYMIPLCCAIGHLKYSLNIDEVRRNIEEFVKKYERGSVHVDVEERKINLDTVLVINLKRITDEGAKLITILFKKNK